MAFNKDKLKEKMQKVIYGGERIAPKVNINIGGLLDVPTAEFVIGRKGETIINGGLSISTLVCGIANNYKSTITNYMLLSAANKIKESGLPTSMTTYDTEDSYHLQRVNSFASRFKHIEPNPATSESREWVITSRVEDSKAEEWLKKVEESVDEKRKEKDLIVPIECFTNPYDGKNLEMLIPTFLTIDSISQFEGSSALKLLDVGVDSKDSNTYFMKAGLFKTKFISILPTLLGSGKVYFITTAHLGSKIEMSTGPMMPPAQKSLQFLKSNQYIKGVGSKLDFLISTAFLCQGARLLSNKDTGYAEFPRDENDKSETDLNIVRVTVLRSKNGASGCNIELIVSQIEGVLPTLSEFYYCKSRDNYGIDGNNRNYHMVLYPDCNLSRTTVRKKIDNDSRLRRAINITAELKQLELHHPTYLHDNGLACTPQELYEDIKKLGYDWNEILDTRGYWLFDQYSNEIPFLSTIDLLKMRKGLYTPYWKQGEKKENGK